MFAGDWPVCYALNLHSRIATRVLLRVAAKGYTKEDDIYRLALETAWPQWFLPTQTLRVDITAIKSPLKSLDFVTLRVKDGICDRFRRDCNDVRPSIDTRAPDVRVQAFLTEDSCTLYIDTSGDPLWQRGLRQKSVEAPLKENLAAGILRLTGWQPGTRSSTRCAAAVPSCSKPPRSPTPSPRAAAAVSPSNGSRASIRSPGAACARRRWRAKKPAAWADIFGADLAAIGARRNRQPRSRRPARRRRADPVRHPRGCRAGQSRHPPLQPALRRAPRGTGIAGRLLSATGQRTEKTSPAGPATSSPPTCACRS